MPVRDFNIRVLRLGERIRDLPGAQDFAANSPRVSVSAAYPAISTKQNVASMDLPAVMRIFTTWLSSAGRELNWKHPPSRGVRREPVVRHSRA